MVKVECASSDAERVLAKIEALEPPARFRLVAQLLEARKEQLALSVAQFAMAELVSVCSSRKRHGRRA